MKQIITSLLLVSAFSATAQTAVIPPDMTGKPSQIGHASPIRQIKCSGVLKPKNGDYIWKPVLQHNIEGIEHGTPNEKLLDSLNEVFYNLKMQKRKTGLGDKKTTSFYPTIGKNFAGNPNTGETPLDNNIAISNEGEIVSLANKSIYCYDTFGTLLFYNTLVGFIGDSSVISDVCDPVIVYDPNYDKFIFYCQQSNISAGNDIIICFSKTNNPAGAWWYYKMEGDPTGSGDLFDYPKIAINDSELFITGNLYSEPSNDYVQSVIYQMNKLDGYAGSPLNNVYYSSILGSPFTILPVSWGQNADITTGMLLVSVNSSGADSINYYRIYGNNCCSPTYTYQSIPTTTYLAPSDAPQLGTAINLEVNRNACRAMSGFYLNGIIHFVFTSCSATTYDDVINYNRLDLSTLTNTSSEIDITGYDCAYPAIASYGTSTTDKSVMIGFGCSNSSVYPEIAAIYCNDAMSWSDAALVYSSASYAADGGGHSPSTNRWGDYTGMARYQHSTTAPIVWMNGMYSDVTNNWKTWISEIYGGVTSLKANEFNEPQNISKVFPNPTSGNFKVEFSLEQDCDLNITVVDNVGRTVKELYNGKASNGDNVFSFDKSNLTTGVYYLAIKANSQVVKNEKIVIE